MDPCAKGPPLGLRRPWYFGDAVYFFKHERVREWRCVTYSHVSSGPAIAGILLSLQNELAEDSAYSEQACRAIMAQVEVWLMKAMVNEALLGDRL